MKAIREFTTYKSAQDFSIENYLFAVSQISDSDLRKMMVAQNHPLIPGKDDTFIEAFSRVFPTLPRTGEELALYLKYSYPSNAKYIPITFLREVAAEYAEPILVVAKARSILLPAAAMNYPDQDPDCDVIVDRDYLELTKEGWIYRAYED